MFMSSYLTIQDFLIVLYQIASINLRLFLLFFLQYSLKTAYCITLYYWKQFMKFIMIFHLNITQLIETKFQETSVLLLSILKCTFICKKIKKKKNYMAASFISHTKLINLFFIFVTSKVRKYVNLDNLQKKHKIIFSLTWKKFKLSWFQLPT